MFDSAYLRQQAERCERLARECAVEDIAKELKRMASRYTAQADSARSIELTARAA
ncbi:hypothetical protein GJW-30_1_01237 [Variibacter gotjawalensis]|uniref:Uncharacterized protein n=1 Tax=Variibacter gotjawalensis TaxID=1333996 RepID=A0A0S3PRY5_9BRAD|nr:hypothetical protein [Variibacter gotjawalensis]NIK49020.1 hypothetical protein [Variibacter gotjawalensis]RZS50876.1 hypothetical protein EV661_3347 [Variibacter gotjawalensis]BAT58710.1 hypothetical protein GJW-30_1_01237 [Variibacter gotjawalensis]